MQLQELIIDWIKEQEWPSGFNVAATMGSIVTYQSESPIPAPHITYLPYKVVCRVLDDSVDLYYNPSKPIDPPYNAPQKLLAADPEFFSTLSHVILYTINQFDI